VITALILTLTITLMLSLFAWKSKKEINLSGSFWWMLVWVMIALPLMIIIFRPVLGLSGAYTFLSVFFVLLYGFFIVYDTKLIIGQRKSGIQLEIDEYIVGALLLYTDVVGLFLNLLSLVRN